MNKVIIRRATIEDISHITDIEKQAGSVFSEMPFEFLCRLPQELPLHTYAFYEEAIKHHSIWLAELDSRIVGFICTQNIDDESSIHISEFSVDYSYQRQGIGNQLINFVIELANSEQRNITLTTFSNVPWNGHFYEKLGFVTLDNNQLNERLTSLIRHEVALGLPKQYRCAMILLA